MAPAIAILGAGPSGLALARFLEIANIAYIIFERDESATWAVGRGGTLDLHVESGQLALKAAGLLDQFRSLARLDATNAIADMNGKVIVKAAEGDSDRPEIDRRDLAALLLGSFPAEKVCWGFRVQHVQKDSDGSVSVHFANGKVESGFQLVVGADGAWSRARSLVTSARPQYSGLQYLTSIIKPDSPIHSSAVSLAGPGNYIALGEEKQIAVQRLGDGTYYLAVGLRLPENWSTENVTLLRNSSALRQALVKDHFSNWPRVHTDLIAESDGDFRAWPLYAMPTESLSWQTVPGIALIGDAAHVTTPFVGEGVNCALHDSLQLSQQIIKYGLDNLDRAVSEYEELMFPRAIKLIQESAMSGELLFAPDAPQGWLKAFTGFDSA